LMAHSLISRVNNNVKWWGDSCCQWWCWWKLNSYCTNTSLNCTAVVINNLVERLVFYQCLLPTLPPFAFCDEKCMYQG
jgi:hypothetical protein